MRIQRSIEVRCSQEHMWFLLTDPEQLKRWNTDIVREERDSDEIGVGSRSRVLIREGAKEVWYENEILVYDEPSALTLQLRGGNLGDGPMSVAYTNRPIGPDAVEVTFTSEWAAVGLLLKLLSPIISMAARGNAQRAMERLKAVAESD